MAPGPGPSTPVFPASSVKGPRMSTRTNATPASGSSFSFSASNHGAGQTMSVPSTQVVPSIGAQTPLPDIGNMEEVDAVMQSSTSDPMSNAFRAIIGPSTPVKRSKRPVPSRAYISLGNGYRATHDTASSGRVRPNAVVPRASAQSTYGTPPTFKVRMSGGVPGKSAKLEDRLM